MLGAPHGAPDTAPSANLQVITAFLLMPWKAFDLMLVTLFGIVMLVRLPQLENALLPMLVTLFGIVMLVRLPQSENALLPILVTLSGIVMLARLMQ